MSWRRVRLTVPVLLAAAGVAILIGCIPWSEHKADHRHSWTVGGFRHGKTSRADVVKKLGEPTETEPGKLLYEWPAEDSDGWLTLCGYIAWTTDPYVRGVAVELDEHDRVKRAYYYNKPHRSLLPRWQRQGWIERFPLATTQTTTTRATPATLPATLPTTNRG